MKNKNNLIICLLIVTFVFSLQVQAQFIPVPGSTNNSWGTSTTPVVGAIGIGQFTGYNLPSALTVDGNLMPTATGEVFSTNGPASVTQAWRMYKGSGTGTEIFNIRNDNGSATPYDVTLGTLQNGNLNFKAGNWPRMTIDYNTGYVGVGDYSIFSPVELLHQHLIVSSNFGNWHQFTNDVTGSQPYNGFKLGINYTHDLLTFASFYSRAEIKQQEDAPLWIFTKNDPRMTFTTRLIDGSDRTGVGINEYGVGPILNPRSILHLGVDYSSPGNFGGWRTWMNVGTFCGLQHDFAFFGIIPYKGDTTPDIDPPGPLLIDPASAEKNDAVIAWGDNSSPLASFSVVFR